MTSIPPEPGQSYSRQIPGRQHRFLAARDEHALEEMDKPDCEPGALTRTYAQFPLINSVVSRWHGVYKQHIRALLSPWRPTTLLDIGCGGGDIAGALVRWAARDGLQLHITAIDPDARAIDFARANVANQPADTEPVGNQSVSFRRVHSSELVADGAVFDFVISNHMIHHLTRAELQGLLTDSAVLARQAVIHSDIVRSPLAYAAFSLATLPFFPGSFIRRDGLTSIRRSYTGSEMRAVLPPGWRVKTAFPYRILMLYSPVAAHV